MVNISGYSFAVLVINIFSLAFSDFPAEYVTPGSKYLSAKTFESLNELFTASQEIQDWLTECAKVILIFYHKIISPKCSIDGIGVDREMKGHE